MFLNNTHFVPYLVDQVSIPGVQDEDLEDDGSSITDVLSDLDMTIEPSENDSSRDEENESHAAGLSDGKSRVDSS